MLRKALSHTKDETIFLMRVNWHAGKFDTDLSVVMMIMELI